MSKSTATTSAEVWRTIEETNRQIKEIWRRMEIMSAEADRRMEQSRQEMDKRMEESRQEMDKRSAETDRRMEKSRQEMDKRSAEADRRMEQSRQEMDKRSAEADRRIEQSRQEMDKRMEKRAAEADRRMDKQMEKRAAEADRQIAESRRELKEARIFFSTQWGVLIESLVEGDLVKLLLQRNIKVIQTSTNESRWIHYKDADGRPQQIYREIDILAKNGIEIVAVEVKATLTRKSVRRFLSTLELFKQLFPEYKERTVYGAVAYLRTKRDAHIYAEEKGLFVIRATGDSASIVNKEDFEPEAFPQQ